MVWRVQNHAMDLFLLGGENALLLNIDATKGNTMCTQIPRQTPRNELNKILPDSWITNYEKLREPEESLQSGEPTFTKRNDKIISISFDHSHLKKSNKTIFSFQVIKSKDTDPNPESEPFWNIQTIMEEHDWCQHFDKEGRRFWWFKCPFTGHCPWDIGCDCQDCLEDPIGEYDEYHQYLLERFGLNNTKPKSKKKGKTSEKQFQAKYENKDPSIGLLSRSDKYEFLVNYKPQEWPKLPEKFTQSWEDSEITPKPKLPSTHTSESKNPPEPKTLPTQKTPKPTKPQIFMLSPSSSVIPKIFLHFNLLKKRV
ncbi:uncharacterized protein LOC107797629 [Nicotiana tabacum]|uniref:Uncharacterized protein LOC107797629 n=3 Tax=Nicotiana tabacum TaxID=4097 RepID=A0AC58USL4_TOBAC